MVTKGGNGFEAKIFKSDSHNGSTHFHGNGAFVLLGHKHLALIGGCLQNPSNRRQRWTSFGCQFTMNPLEHFEKRRVSIKNANIQSVRTQSVAKCCQLNSCFSTSLCQSLNNKVGKSSVFIWSYKSSKFSWVNSGSDWFESKERTAVVRTNSYRV